VCHRNKARKNTQELLNLLFRDQIRKVQKGICKTTTGEKPSDFAQGNSAL